MSNDHHTPRDGDGDEGVEVVDELTIVNEFGLARVRKLRTRNGERLEIHSPRFGHTLRLDALALEGLSWQSPDTISQYLVNPIGPEDDDEHGADGPA
jgi:hypothetical protein